MMTVCVIGSASLTIVPDAAMPESPAIAISAAALGDVPSPCFVVDEALIELNARLLADVQQRAGCDILLALKGFAMWPTFDVLRQHLAGVTASSLHEALLGVEEFRRQVHAYAPAYSDSDLPRYLDLCDHLTFNSFSQWQRFAPRVASHPNPPAIALRINPEHSEVDTPLYDPCAPGSRLGITLDQFEQGVRQFGLTGITGLHFHTLCELNSDALERTLAAVEAKFGSYLTQITWLNFGGGHHITRPDYDVERLIQLVQNFRERTGLAVYLEPGEAVALNTGVLLATVLDIMHNDMPIAMLDVSATAHMPDVLEMPYRPEIEGAAQPGVKAHTYRLGGLSCLAGDVIGEYSFDEPLHVGDRIVFGDMAHYSMVKTTTFNGVRHPAIAIHNSDTGHTRVVRSFHYEDFKRRLG